MKENNKLIDAIIDLGTGMKELRMEIKGMRKDMNHRLENLEKQQQKNNILLAEHSRTIMTLAEQQDKTNTKLEGLRFEFKGMRSDFNKYAKANDTKVNGHEKRIVRIEDAISDNGGKGISMAKEPKTRYKKKKKK